MAPIRRSVVWVILVVWFCASASFAEVPHLLTFQGRLRDSTSAPYTGTKLIKFTIYDKDGIAIWNSGFQSQSFTDGLVTVELGTPPQPAFPTGDWATDTGLTLGITVDSDPEIAPRIRFTTGGYAFHSLDADKLDGQDANAFAGAAHTHALSDLSNVTAPAPADGQVLTYKSASSDWQPATPPAGGGSGFTDDGNVVRLTTTGDRVGVGTPTPAAKLEILGKGPSGYSLNDNDVLYVVPDSPFVGINRYFKVIPEEVFGVHSPKPGFGGMFVSAATASDQPFYGYSAGGLLSAYHYVDGPSHKWTLWNYGSNRLCVDSLGNMGVGTLAPDARIHAESSGPYAGHFHSPLIAVKVNAGEIGVDAAVGPVGAPGPNAAAQGFRTQVFGAGAGYAYGVNAQALGGDEAYGLRGDATNATTTAYGVYGSAFGTAAYNYGVYGEATGSAINTGGFFKSDKYGVDIEVGDFVTPTTKSNPAGVRSVVYAEAGQDIHGVVTQALFGKSVYGVQAFATNAAEAGYGLYGEAFGPSPVNYGVYGTATGGTRNYAGYFSKGDPGAVTPAANSIAVFESGIHGYLSVLGPDIYEKGILFGQPANEAAGGVVYNAGAVPNGLSFRTLDNTTRMVITSTGNVGIGTTSPSQRLSVSGSICYTGSIGACSDARFKTDVRPLGHVLERVLNLHGVTYHWRSDAFPDRNFDGARHMGFIAQEVESQFPDVVLTDGEGYRSVDYGRLTPVLVEAIREQQGTIRELKKEVSELRGLVDRLSRALPAVVAEKATP